MNPTPPRPWPLTRTPSRVAAPDPARRRFAVAASEAAGVVRWARVRMNGSPLVGGARRTAPGTPISDRGGERGSITVWFLTMSVVFVLMAGVVVDAGRAVAVKMRATTVAGQAARKTVDAIDPEAVRQGTPIPSDTATAGACGWVATKLPGALCSADLGAGGSVTVHVQASSPTSVLRTVGVEAIAVSATQSASPQTGAQAPQEG